MEEAGGHEAAASASPSVGNAEPSAAPRSADVDWKSIAKRERKKQQRRELLRSMTLEERKQFIHSENDEKANQIERMRTAMESASGHVRLAIDLRYDNIMNDKELNSLAKQIKLVYGSVKTMREPAPFQLRFFHCSEQVKESLARFNAERWFVHWHEQEELTDVASASDIVYLSPDSPNVLETLDAKKMYVIGGIVDKSRKKGATLQTAESAGVTSARLPIQEYIPKRLDHILNVNTVVDILIHFHTHRDWKRALTDVLPQRKQNDVGRRSVLRQQRREKKSQQHTEHVQDGRNDAEEKENLEDGIGQNIPVQQTDS